MPRKKKLKTNGNSILDFSVNLKNVESNYDGSMIEVLDLRVTTNDGDFVYEICSDTRAPDLAQIKNHIETSLNKATANLLNVEISEYKERNYLFFNVQKIGQRQYTGRRV